MNVMSEFMDSLQWNDAKDYPITLVIWMFLLSLLPIEEHWTELMFLVAGGIILGSVLDYRGKLQNRHQGVVMS